MEISVDKFMPILFYVLMAFVSINMVINFILLLTRQKRIYKLLATYWPCVLLVFWIQGMFLQSNLDIILAYSATLVPLTIFSMIGFEVRGRKFPLKNYVIYFLCLYPVTFVLDRMGHSFTIVAMPFAVATATPIFHTFYLIHIKDRQQSTRLQKILGAVYFMVAVHCINFALFRMEPETQLWGWLITYALYDSMAVLLPSIALEEANLTENERLQNLVEVRTSELNKTLRENESLLKVVLHDLSSPLMTMRFYLSYVKALPESEIYMEKTKKSQSSMEKIILEIKNLYGQKNRKEKSHLQPVGIEDCFNDVEFIFADKLIKKNVSLVFNNQLSPNTKVLADQTTLTHSVLSNLVSNGLKFSYPNTQIEVTAREEQNNIVLEVKDQGPGMPQDVISRLFLDEDQDSSQGTAGEVGSGFGLSIVKSFVDSYGGQIEFDSRIIHSHPEGHGTNIKITLDRA
jgi:signal transduction histidine kinase